MPIRRTPIVTETNKNSTPKYNISYDISLNKSHYNLSHHASYNFGVMSATIRSYSTQKLTHVDGDGKARMVDVSPKPVTTRKATARAVVKVGAKISNLIKDNQVRKGDVLSVAQVAGIMGAKKTADLIPLCHNVPLSSIKVTAVLDDELHAVVIKATVVCEGKTGVEMEALTAVSVAALTIYDMCKAISRSMEISKIELISKSGGVNGDYDKEGGEQLGVESKIPQASEGIFIGTL